MVDRIVTVPDSLELPASVKVPSARLSDSTATGRAVLAAADSAAARAAIGIYELRGTGMPNGAVTATPGTYYTDTAGTNGAWRWLKTSGTGNTGWEVVIGDTGWRDISSLVTNGWTAAGLMIRRIGTSVTIALRNLNPASATGEAIITTPIFGFAPTLRATFPTVASPENVFTNASVREDSGQIHLKRGSGSISVYQYSYWTYLTSDAWPTTLPGTPA